MTALPRPPRRDGAAFAAALAGLAVGLVLFTPNPVLAGPILVVAIIVAYRAGGGE